MWKIATFGKFWQRISLQKETDINSNSLLWLVAKIGNL